MNPYPTPRRAAFLFAYTAAAALCLPPSAPAQSAGQPTEPSAGRSAGVPVPAAAGAAADTLRIGTWNLEWFGQRKDPRTAADVARVGALIGELGVSLLAVQEVANEAALQRLCAAIGPDWSFVLGTSGGWRDQPNRQSIGFVFDGARVEVLHAEELMQLPRELEGVPIFHRVPVTVCCRDRRTGVDFRAVTVHFKASRGPVNEQKRRLEATELAGWLRSLQERPGEDQDYVVLGDFNSTYGDEPQRALERGAVARYLPQPTAEPTIMHFDTPIDMVAVSPAFAEVQAPTLDSHSELGGADEAGRLRWRQTYSDHFPVTVALRGRGDDDPAAAFARGPRTQWLAVGRQPGPEPQVAVPQAGAPQPADAAPAPRAPVDPELRPFAVGDRVAVHCDDAKVYQGVLIAPLDGAWVQLRPTNLRAVAVPAGRVLRIERVR